MSYSRFTKNVLQKSELSLRDAIEKKKCDKCHIGFDPPPNVTKITMHFFKKLDHFWGTLELLKLVKNG